MAQHARLFVGKQNVLVLIYDVYSRLSDLEICILLARLFKKLIVYVKAQNIALVKARVALCALAVELYALYPYILLKQRFRQERHGLSDKSVKPLSRVVSPYCKLFHIELLYTPGHKKIKPPMLLGSLTVYFHSIMPSACP